MATISRKGFAQVEPNHLSGIVTGQILAQLPVDTATMGTVIENGRFAKYDYATGKVNLTGAGEWMLIYNEEKLYDERKQHHKDFAMIAGNYTDGEIVPRLIQLTLLVEQLLLTLRKLQVLTLLKVILYLLVQTDG